MLLRSAFTGLLATAALLCAGNSLANDPAQPSVSEGAVPAESAEPAASAEAAPPAAEGEGVAEATEADATTDAKPAETSLEEAAAQAQNMGVEQGKPFDPTKASRKELDAFNADREPDQKIKCVQTYPTGSRRPTKVCMTQSQWRQWQKANQ